MPLPGRRWWHLTLSVRGAWLPGDPRGFRSRQHRIHSSGDYRRRPPAGEHAGLHAFAKSIAAPPVAIPAALRESLACAMVQGFETRGGRPLALAVSGLHVHGLVELPSDYRQARRDVGQAKRLASHQLREQLPGRIWGQGCGLKPIDDPSHHRNTYRYILRHRDEGAWVWTFRDVEGQPEIRT